MKESGIINRVWILSLVFALFLSYPNMAWMGCELSFLDQSEHLRFLLFFAARFCWFWLLAYALLHYNLRYVSNMNFIKRLICNLIFAAIGFALYELASKTLDFSKYDRFISILIFQFAILGVFATVFGYISYLYDSRQEKERELAQIRIDSLQTQLGDLTNQINPHFFFNSLNGISSLVRKQDQERTLNYIDRLSDIFRYTLQSEKRGLVPLREELEFVEAFRSVMEVRYANKLHISIDVPEQLKEITVPVLSLLPLLENITIHNRIDSDHPMKVSITSRDKTLIVSNTLQPKKSIPPTNGTGLANLSHRYQVLKGMDISIEKDDQSFSVILPL